jgi:hypothetical protein
MHRLRGFNDSSGSRNGKAPSGGPDAFDYRGYPDVKHCVNWVGRVVVVAAEAPLTTESEALTGKTQAGKKKTQTAGKEQTHTVQESGTIRNAANRPSISTFQYQDRHSLIR